jgi:hypothetical protein
MAKHNETLVKHNGKFKLNLMAKHNDLTLAKHNG